MLEMEAAADEESSSSPGHDYEQILKIIGFGKVQWIVLLVSGLLLMMVINETMGMSVITIVSQCDFETNSSEKAFLSAACFIGILISSFFWGYLSDTEGRKFVLVYSTLIGNLVSFISIFVPNFWVFTGLRFIVGFFIAGASASMYAYLGEFVTIRYRALVINYASMFVGFSTVYVPAVAWLVLQMDWKLQITESFQFRPWRLLILFNILPGFIGALLLLALPESPKILLTLQRYDEAYSAVDWMCQLNKAKSLHDFNIKAIRTEAKVESVGEVHGKSLLSTVKRMCNDTSPLLKRPYVFNFLVSCIVMCGLFFSSSGMGLWYPEIQNRLAYHAKENRLSICEVIDASINNQQRHQNSTENVCSDHITTKSYVDTITYGGALIVGYIILGLVINPLGRKVTIIGSLAISAACGLVLIWILDPMWIVIFFCLYLILPCLCISVLSSAVVDLVPTHLRGKAVCICLMLGRTGSIFGSNIIGVLLESYCTVTFSVFSGFVLVCAFLTLMLPI